MKSRERWAGAKGTDFRGCRRTACRALAFGDSRGSGVRSRGVRPPGSRVLGSHLESATAATSCLPVSAADLRAAAPPNPSPELSTRAKPELRLKGSDWGQKQEGASLWLQRGVQRERRRGKERERDELEFAANPLPETFQKELSFLKSSTSCGLIDTLVQLGNNCSARRGRFTPLLCKTRFDSLVLVLFVPRSG